MKNLLAIVLIAGYSVNQGASGQETPAPPPNPSFSERLNTIVRRAAGSEAAEPKASLTRFDLDFPGGTPHDLVIAIEKSSGRPLNIVIPLANAETSLPPLKMRGVTAPELFGALEAASEGTTVGQTRNYGNQRSRPGVDTPPGVRNRNTTYQWIKYRFHTLDRPPRDDSVWYFSSEASEESKTCRFWQLGPYLETYTIDDITTAIQTGYKMLGEVAPEINFHKDTKLLIAVGEESRLALIDAALQQLQFRKEPPRNTRAEPRNK